MGRQTDEQDSSWLTGENGIVSRRYLNWKFCILSIYIFVEVALYKTASCVCVYFLWQLQHATDVSSTSRRRGRREAAGVELLISGRLIVGSRAVLGRWQSAAISSGRINGPKSGVDR